MQQEQQPVQLINVSRATFDNRVFTTVTGSYLTFNNCTMDSFIGERATFNQCRIGELLGDRHILSDCTIVSYAGNYGEFTDVVQYEVRGERNTLLRGSVTQITGDRNILQSPNAQLVFIRGDYNECHNTQVHEVWGERNTLTDCTVNRITGDRNIMLRGMVNEVHGNYCSCTNVQTVEIRGERNTMNGGSTVIMMGRPRYNPVDPPRPIQYQGRITMINQDRNIAIDIPMPTDIRVGPPPVDPPIITVMPEEFVENKTDEESLQCILCYDNEQSACLLNCGHTHYCVQCLRKLIDPATQQLHCPSCRALTVRVVRTF